MVLEYVITIKARGKNGRWKYAKSMPKKEFMSLFSVTENIKKPKKPLFVSKKKWETLFKHAYNQGLYDQKYLIENRLQGALYSKR
jgi:hypothetical protein